MSEQFSNIEKMMENMFASESEEGTSGSVYEPPNDENESSSDTEDEDRRGNQEEAILQQVQENAVVLNELEPDRKGKKRIRQEKKWKRNVLKTKRARGEQYTTKLGKKIPAKKVDQTPCVCLNKCHLKINAERQKQIFEEYYGLSNYNLQSSFLFSMVKVVNKQRTYTQSRNSRKAKTRFYHLIGKDGSEIKVCKSFFQKTLQVSAGRLDRVLKLKGNTTVPPTDRRGLAPSANKTPTEKINEVKKFIDKFPTYESHYSLHKSLNRKYLAPDLSINKMYSLYCNSNSSQDVVSVHIFRKIFNENYNLTFHAPLSDTCRKCDNFEVKILASDSDVEKNNLSVQKKLHLTKAELARSQMRADRLNAKTNENVTAIAFDLMKTLPTPVLTTGVCYYKRQMWTYCLGIHNLGTDQVTMFVWDESVASRGPQEVGSCILYYIKHYVKTTKLIMYSDQCGGQNRNIKLSVLCQYIVSHPNYVVNEIDHKFLVSGHSYLPCDQDFGLVEKQKKLFKDIFVPDNWFDVIRAARKKEPFIIVKMKAEHFISTKKLECNIVNRKRSLDGSKVEWLKFQWLRFKKDEPFKFFYKYSNNPILEFSHVDIKKRNSITITELDLLYPQGNTISELKKKDLIALLDYVPPIYHDFYKNLKTDKTKSDVIDTQSISSDSEDE